MKESYDEGVESHIGPESCGGGSNAMCEALKGVRAGQVLSREMHVNSGVLTIWVSRKATPGMSLREICPDPARSETLARTETPCTGTGGSCARPCQILGPHWEV